MRSADSNTIFNIMPQNTIPPNYSTNVFTGCDDDDDNINGVGYKLVQKIEIGGAKNGTYTSIPQIYMKVDCGNQLTGVMNFISIIIIIIIYVIFQTYVTLGMNISIASPESRVFYYLWTQGVVLTHLLTVDVARIFGWLRHCSVIYSCMTGRSGWFCSGSLSIGILTFEVSYLCLFDVFCTYCRYILFMVSLAICWCIRQIDFGCIGNRIW